MAHYGTLQDYQFSNDVDDIRGTDVFDRAEEKLGSVKDVVFNHETGDIRYLVVDRHGKNYLVPRQYMFRTVRDENDFLIDMSVEQFESLPTIDNDDLKREHDWDQHHNRMKDAIKNWRDEMQKKYKRDFTDAPVEHREFSDHLVTPPPDQEPPMPNTPENEDYHPDLTPTRLQDKFVEPIEHPGKVSMKPESARDKSNDQAYVATGRFPSRMWNETRGSTEGDNIGGHYDWMMSDRWGRFEDLLRKNRVDIQAKCPSCAPARDKNAA
jgi:sporulation protein YlmC with PRC-barrel domain